MQNGERVAGIEKDPLLDTESDVHYDYSSVPGFVKREASVIDNDSLKLQPHPESLKHVEKMLKKAKEVKEHHGSLEVVNEEQPVSSPAEKTEANNNLVTSEIIVEEKKEEVVVDQVVTEAVKKEVVHQEEITKVEVSQEKVEVVVDKKEEVHVEKEVVEEKPAEKQSEVINDNK